MSGRVAFVVQRCGLEVNGGAELLCRMVAERLARHLKVEVLTTCALDYMTWENHYPPGEERMGELRIRRFPVERLRDVDSFNRLSESVRARKGKLSVADEEAWMREQGPWSPDLLEYLKANREEYGAFIFVTYLYATTYFGLPLVRDKALLVPLSAGAALCVVAFQLRWLNGRVSGVASYSRFRKFEVKSSEELAAPAADAQPDKPQ